MDKNCYETGLLLASGAALGQVILILVEMTFSLWSFVPTLFLIGLFGYTSLKALARNKGLVTTGVRTRLTTGAWMFFVWDLCRRRFIWPIDILKFILLFVVLYLLYRVVKRTWEV